MKPDRPVSRRAGGAAPQNPKNRVRDAAPAVVREPWGDRNASTRSTTPARSRHQHRRVGGLSKSMEDIRRLEFLCSPSWVWMVRSGVYSIHWRGRAGGRAGQGRAGTSRGLGRGVRRSEGTWLRAGPESPRRVAVRGNGLGGGVQPRSRNGVLIVVVREEDVRRMRRAFPQCQRKLRGSPWQFT